MRQRGKWKAAILFPFPTMAAAGETIWQQRQNSWEGNGTGCRQKSPRWPELLLSLTPCILRLLSYSGLSDYCWWYSTLSKNFQFGKKNVTFSAIFRQILDQTVLSDGGNHSNQGRSLPNSKSLATFSLSLRQIQTSSDGTAYCAKKYNLEFKFCHFSTIFRLILDQPVLSDVGSRSSQGRPLPNSQVTGNFLTCPQVPLML